MGDLAGFGADDVGGLVVLLAKGGVGDAARHHGGSEEEEEGEEAEEEEEEEKEEKWWMRWAKRDPPSGTLIPRKSMIPRRVVCLSVCQDAMERDGDEGGTGASSSSRCAAQPTWDRAMQHAFSLSLSFLFFFSFLFPAEPLILTLWPLPARLAALLLPKAQGS
ncbi:hypothetical protein VTN02DRAFT_1489 [Thermoascus thermophilus]